MPELPEVETTRLGLEPHVQARRICALSVRNGKLRQPVPPELAERLPGLRIAAIVRRAKYLLLDCEVGAVLIHLGMSGSLRIVTDHAPPTAHEHWDLALDNGVLLRYKDPRRFGLLLWAAAPQLSHPLLARLGPEPLSAEFDGAYLHRISRNKSLAIKALLMDSHRVAGVGNIYANESLFMAGIAPTQVAGQLTPFQCDALASAVKRVLAAAIAQGGTTLRDFTASDGKPGYFQVALQVYGRQGKLCPQCGTAIVKIVQMQRASYFCPECQRACLP